MDVNIKYFIYIFEKYKKLNFSNIPYNFIKKLNQNFFKICKKILGNLIQKRVIYTNQCKIKDKC